VTGGVHREGRELIAGVLLRRDLLADDPAGRSGKLDTLLQPSRVWARPDAAHQSISAAWRCRTSRAASKAALATAASAPCWEPIDPPQLSLIRWFIPFDRIAALGRPLARLPRPKRPKEVGHEARRQVKPRQIAALLAQTDLFGVLDEETLEQLATRTRVRAVDKGQTIFVQDEPGDRMFVLAEGAVKLVVRSAQGEVVELARHWPPAAFGEVALLDGGPRSASAEALERSTLLVVTRDDLIGLLRADRQVVDAVLKSLGTMVRRADRLATDLVFLDLPSRVARRLLELAEDSAGASPRTRRVTQTELANMVGGTRQSVNLALRTLEERGCIRLVGLTIELLDPDELRRRAGW
jgi:CRP/FNR family cyclic AMP-dependent transcriptional regulator